MRKRKELLRKQLELLAEQSKSAEDNDLARMSSAMCEVYRELQRDCRNWRSLNFAALLFAVSLYSLICFLVHI